MHFPVPPIKDGTLQSAYKWRRHLYEREKIEILLKTGNGQCSDYEAGWKEFH